MVKLTLLYDKSSLTFVMEPSRLIFTYFQNFTFKKNIILESEYKMFCIMVPNCFFHGYISAACCRQSVSGCGGSVCGCQQMSPGPIWRTVKVGSMLKPLNFTLLCLAPSAYSLSDTCLRGENSLNVSLHVREFFYSMMYWQTFHNQMFMGDVVLSLSLLLVCCCRYLATPLADVWGVRDRVRCAAEPNPVLENYFCRQARLPSQAC